MDKPSPRDAVLKEMRACIGTRDPVVFFGKMVDAFELLFEKAEAMEMDLKEARKNAALAIEWEPQVARTMLTDQINLLREDRETYFDEISELKKAFVEDKITQSYKDFCAFWQETLGFHPFLRYQ